VYSTVFNPNEQITVACVPSRRYSFGAASIDRLSFDTGGCEQKEDIERQQPHRLYNPYGT
jgi:hypothetical protein